MADFKKMAQRVLAHSESLDHVSRKRRMQSIITTCEIAESVMNFVITIAHNRTRSEYDAQYESMVKRLPKALDLLTQTAGPLTDFTLNIKDNLTEKFKNNFKGIL